MLLIMVCRSVSAQVSSDSLRSAHIKNFSSYFFVGAVLKQRDLNFRLASRVKPSENYFFKPNTSYSTGVTLNIFDVGIEASFSIPINIKNRERFGTSQVFDLQTSAQGNQWMADAYLQKYSGFYVTTPDLKARLTPVYPQRPDLKADNFGISFAYIFNHKKFSMRSSYSFTEQQKSSAGSLLFSYILSSFNLSADSSLIPSSHWADAGIGASAKNGRFTSLGIAPGYSYNFVFRNFFLNATLAIGPAHYWLKYQLANGAILHDIRIDLYSSLRLGIGYNGERFFSGVSFSSQGRSVHYEQINFSNSIDTFRIVIGYRFREKGILTKTIGDYIPRKFKKPG